MIAQVNVLIDGREIGKRRGIGHFCRELLYNINEKCAGGTRKYYCAVPVGTSDYVMAAHPNITFIKMNSSNAVIWEQVYLPLAARRLAAAFLVCPYNTFPIIVPSGCTRVIVYHDLIFLHGKRVGGSRTLRLGNRYRSCLLRFLRPSDRLVSVSAYTQDVLRRKIGRRSEVIGNSCRHLAAVFKSVGSPVAEGQYFLHIGGDATTKNTEHTVRCYLAAANSMQEFPNLIVMGVSLGYANYLKKKYSLGENVKFRLDISDLDKCALVKGAVASVFVSKKEGFGLPIIEAQAAGTRVITSRRRPMSDLASKLDILVNPLSEDDLIEAYRASVPKTTSTLSEPVSYDQFAILEAILA